MRAVLLNGKPGLRWLTKKAARKAFAVGSFAGRVRGRRSSTGVHVLTYHHIGDDDPHDPFCVSRSDFDLHMAWLAERHLAISLSQFEAFLAGRGTIPEDAILVTLDDGLRSLYLDALPTLERHGVPAVAFVSAGEMRPSNGSGTPVASRDPLSWSELATVASSGMAIGSHAYTHRSLGRMPADQVRDEVVRSRETLEQRLGRRVTTLAYPFGTRADYNHTVAAVCRESGYTCAFTSRHGAVRAGADPFTLPRVKVEGGESTWMFRLLCQGGLDGWRWVDRVLWRLQDSAR